MPFPWAAIAQAAGSLIGGVHANRTNVRLAREQMRFQERMSSTAAQRAKADFEAAGFNPALAYGHTASSPGGASASIEDVIGPAVSGARAAEMQRKEKAFLDQQINVARGQANITGNQALLSDVETGSAIVAATGNRNFGLNGVRIDPDSPLVQALRAEYASRTVNAQNAGRLLEAQIQQMNAATMNARLQNSILGVENQFQQEWGVGARKAKVISDTLGGAVMPAITGLYGAGAKFAAEMFKRGMPNQYRRR